MTDNELLSAKDDACDAYVRHGRCHQCSDDGVMCDEAFALLKRAAELIDMVNVRGIEQLTVRTPVSASIH